jgi:hypothetical protein
MKPAPPERLGFLSSSGALLAVLFLLVVIGVTAFMGPTLFSPGALGAHDTGRTLGGVSSHAQLGRDCGACHAPPLSSESMAQRCLRCHTDVTQEIASGTGLHGKLAGGVSNPTCRGCHTDHNGPDASLTVVDGRTFPHALTGYSLTGHQRTAAGAKLTCRDCHPNGLARFDQVTCATCHKTINAKFMREHESTFGRDCLTCHDGTDRFGAGFDHDRLAFPLAGSHAKVPCASCHAKAGSLAALRATPRDCYSCHAKNDHHNGSFGQDCGSCHQPTTWKQATFDHSVFPLDHGSREQKPTCKTCHPKDPSGYTCFGCHAHTPGNILNNHEGRTLADIQDCIKCHRGGQKGGD